MGRLQTGHSSPNIVAGPTDRARPGAWILGPGYWGLDTGAWILGPGYWGLDTGAWILGHGYWGLDTSTPHYSPSFPLHLRSTGSSSTGSFFFPANPSSSSSSESSSSHSLEPQCCICLG